MTHFKKFLAKKKLTWMITFVVILMMAGVVAYLSAEVEKKEAPAQGYLGVNIEKVVPEDQEEFGATFGVLVSHVEKGEAADKAGIKKYDVIQYVNGEKIRTAEDLTEVIRASKPGTEVKIKLIRDKKEKEIPVIVGEFKGGEEKSFRFFPPSPRREFREFRFKSHGAYLGVRLELLDNKDLAEYFGVKPDSGALVIGVDKDSPAEKAGFKAGDVIVQLNGKAVNDPDDARRILESLEKGEKVEIQIIRHNNKMTLNAELDESKGFFGPSGSFNFNFDRWLPMLPELSEHFRHFSGDFMMPPGDEHEMLRDKDLDQKRERLERKRETLERKRGDMERKREDMERDIEKKMDKAEKKIQKKIVKIKDNAYI